MTLHHVLMLPEDNSTGCYFYECKEVNMLLKLKLLQLSISAVFLCKIQKENEYFRTPFIT